MGIVEEDVARVRQASDIVAVVTAHTQLRKVGQRWSGLCPFHSEKSPSFSVNQADGFYYCFGCQASGDVITFVREIEQLDFVGAVEFLAAKAGITLRYTEAGESEARRAEGRRLDAVTRAMDWYHERLTAGADAGAARRYLRSRGFTSAEVDRYHLGWAPEGWDLMLRGTGIPVKLAEECGLGFVNRLGRGQDFFRARVLFPIFDERGRAIGFGGRKLPGAEGAKYQNSRDNSMYHKSRVLYGLNWAKAEMVTAGEAVICEGYTDVVAFHRVGVQRAVATCGTSLTSEHVKVLKRYTNRLVLAYDADAAGQNAAERVFAWEREFEVEVAVVALPGGKDPAELATDDPEALRTALAEARPFLAFRVQRVLDAADLSTVEGRARAGRAAAKVVAEHPDSMVRDPYLMEIADRCRVSVEDLRVVAAATRQAEPGRSGRSGAGRTGGGKPGDGGGGATPRWDDAPWPDDGAEAGMGGGVSTEDRFWPSEPGAPEVGSAAWAGAGRSGAGGSAGTPQRRGRARIPIIELEALRLLAHRPDEVTDRIHPALLGDPLTRRAAEMLIAAHGVAAALGAAGLDAAEVGGGPQDGREGEVAALLARLAVEEPTSETDDAIAGLVLAAGRRAHDDVAAEARSSADPLAYSGLLTWIKQRLLDISEGTAPGSVGRESVAALLAWLLDRDSARVHPGAGVLFPEKAEGGRAGSDVTSESPGSTPADPQSGRRPGNGPMTP